MKTHMNNTVALSMANDILSQAAFRKHQQILHSQKIKPQIVTKHKNQVKIVKNKKVQLTTNPNQHVNHLFSNLHTKKQNIKSTIDNKVPESYHLKQTILKDRLKKNKQQKHAQTQHQKQWKALQNRIQNCKSIQQRKKDNTDPIVNPVYFIKNSSKVQQLSIEPYCKKILDKNRPKSAITAGGRGGTTSYQMTNTYINSIQQPKSIYYGSAVPDFSKTSTHKKSSSIRPSTANQGTKGKQNNRNQSQIAKKYDDLPQPSYKGILKHLLTNKIYKDADVKVLYVRLCYAYGQDNIDEIWEQVMDELER